MKKKEDMMKHSKDGRTAFRIGKILTNLVIISFSLFITVSAQIELNNFGVTDILKTHLRYTKFSVIDYNNDNLNDLFLYGNQEKSFVIHKGIKDSTFGEAVRKFFFFPIDDFKWLNKSATGDDYYIFASRNRRLVGLVSFTKSNSLQLLNTIQFDSYPSSIKITDFNKDGINEALVFGSNFDGLKLIRNEGYKLNSETLLEQSLFNDLVIMDYNQDELDDIILIDILNNSLKFLENSEDNIFITSREINRDESILTLDKLDFNNDSFYDLIIGNERGIEIMEGDSVYSFSSSKFISNEYPVESFTLSDFNTDSQLDLAIINKSAGSLDISFNIEGTWQRINYFQNGISDIRILYKKRKNLLVSLSNRGFIKIFSSANRIGKNFNFTAGNTPYKISLERTRPDSPCLVFNNYSDNTVNVITLDKEGNFVKNYQYQFLQNLGEFICAKNHTTIIGYDYDSRLLEFIQTGSNENDAKMNLDNFVYTNFPITDLLVDNNNIIRILEKDDDNLYLSALKNQDGKYIYTHQSLIDSFVVQSILVDNEEILYWKKKKENVTLNSFLKGNIKKMIELSIPDSIPFFTSIEKDHNSDLVFTYIKFADKSKFYFIQKGKVNEFTFNENQRLNLERSKLRLYSYNSGKNLLLNYDTGRSKLKIFEIRQDKKKMSLNNTFEGVHINDYFVTKILGKSYLIFTDSLNNSINFEVLNR